MISHFFFVFLFLSFFDMLPPSGIIINITQIWFDGRCDTSRSILLIQLRRHSIRHRGWSTGENTANIRTQYVQLSLERDIRNDYQRIHGLGAAGAASHQHKVREWWTFIYYNVHRTLYSISTQWRDNHFIYMPLLIQYTCCLHVLCLFLPKIYIIYMLMPFAETVAAAQRWDIGGAQRCTNCGASCANCWFTVGKSS